ncbi:hypothetical protein JCM8208_002486 [Rhodotorula glutinis]
MRLWSSRSCSSLARLVLPLFAQLPLEVIDHIIQLALEGPVGHRHKREHALALVLCRISRAFLPTGRRLLYHAPFISLPATWDRAIVLHDTLSRDNGAIGRMVRNLYGLENWYRRLVHLVAPQGTHTFDLRGQPVKAFAWQASIVAACPSMRAVSVQIQSASEATVLHRALGPSMASLERIKLQSDSYLDAALALRVIANLYRAGCRLKAVELPDLDDTASRKSTEDGNPQLQHPVEDLTIHVSRGTECIELRAAFFPVQVGILRKLDLFFPSKISQVDLVRLLKLAGSSIVELKLSSSWCDVVSEDYAQYGVGFDGPVFPVEAMELFPRLERLKIMSFGALSVHRLSLIQQHCRNLQILDASGSSWLADNPAHSVLVTPQYQQVIFPEQRVAEVLEGMPRLKAVYLGNVPVRATNRLPTLRLAMKIRGTALYYTSCGVRCPSCGDYHW